MGVSAVRVNCSGHAIGWDGATKQGHLTFEVTGRRRQGAWARLAKMYRRLGLGGLPLALRLTEGLAVTGGAGRFFGATPALLLLDQKHSGDQQSSDLPLRD